ncbi:MAG: hypothetical protein RJA70_1745 [Pseudomonadota bacterium]
MSKKKLLALCLLVGAALSCSSKTDSNDEKDDAADAADDSNDDDPVDEGDDASSDGTVPSTYLQIAAVAKLLYDAVEANEDVSPHIEAILQAFDVPILEPDDTKGARARIDAGLPFVTSRVVEQMAAAYSQGRLIDAEGFAEGLVEQGVGLAFPFNADGDDLDSELLGAMLYSYASLGEVTPDVPVEPGYVLPSLVWELGQERGRRTNPGEFDLGWGDGRLDPLQFTLLSFTIFAKPVSPESGPFAGLRPSKRLLANPGAEFIKEQIKNKIKDKVEGDLTSAVQQLVEVPLDKKDAAKVSVCGSLILYGHKVSITNTPKLLWHAPKTPNLTAVEMTLTFEDDYYDNWARAVLGSAVTDLTGCAFPRKGPIEGKAVEWGVSSGLEGHGSYDLMGATTDENGKALASWRTVTDELPKACQVLEKQRDAVGATEAVVSGLLSGWSTVETIVTFLNPNTGTQGNAPLTVLYYQLKTDDTCHVE